MRAADGNVTKVAAMNASEVLQIHYRRSEHIRDATGKRHAFLKYAPHYGYGSAVAYRKNNP